MGSPTSTRWNNHKRAALVENTPSISVVELRRAGLLDRPGATFTVTWTAGQRAVVGFAQARLERESDGRRTLALQVIGAEHFEISVMLVADRPNFGGQRWLFECLEPTCDRRAIKVYLAPEGDRIACRQCLGLTHRSTQAHDKRLDMARRDPSSFAEAREQLQTLNSALVTLHIAEKALAANAAPCRGRGWGRNSMTSWRRAAQELLAELADVNRGQQ